MWPNGCQPRFGIRYFNEEKFAAAVRSFERASEALDDPAIAYNLALAHLAALREYSEKGDAPDLPPKQVAAALAAVAAGQALPEPTEEMLAKLGYIEGEIFVLSGNPDVIRKSFQKSLDADSNFAPTLKAQLELDTDSGTILARLVLATAEIEKLEPEPKLSQ